MDGRVAPGGPASAKFHVTGVIHIADEKMSDAARCRPLILRMTAKAEIGVAYHEHLGIDGAMHVMADSASFPQSLVFENKWPGLSTMALRAGFVQSRHGESERRFHDVLAVRIMALHAVHLAFNDRVMLREVEFGVDFNVALETGCRVLAGVDDEFSPTATRRYVFAGRAMARFTTLHARQLGGVQTQSRVRTGWKCMADGRVTIQADLVANIGGAFDLRRFHQDAGSRGTRNENQSKCSGDHKHPNRPPPAPHGCTPV